LTESTGTTKPVAVIVLGADAVLSARPATPVQLWHACLAVGYDLAVPATWGDELIAAEALRALSTHPETVAVMCSCPMVARALAETRADVARHLVSLVAPPVATARYLRRVYGERRVHISYTGACPAAGDSAIDSWITPAELLARFAASQVVLADQPELFESTLPPDRRRHLSQPGGLPTAERAGAITRPRRIHAVNDADALRSLERHLASNVRTLLDVAPRAGCSCSGMVPGMAASEARIAVTALEPPHSARPVMADPGGLGLIRRVPLSPPKPETEAPPILVTPAERAAVAVAAESRPGHTATRRPTHSPLSWNLRERAHPQPAIGTRTGAAAPVVPRGVSSKTWSLLPHATRASLAEPEPPSAEFTAVAETREPEFEDAPSSPTSDASADAPLGARPHEAEPAASSPAVEPGESSSQEATPPPGGSSHHEPMTRSTPPGGYWFMGPPAGGEVATDIEVERQRPSREFPVMDNDPNHGGSETPAAAPSEELVPDDPPPDDPPHSTPVAASHATPPEVSRSVESTLLSPVTGVVMAAAVLLLGRSPFDRR